jgi:hypothetical protein
MPLLSTGGRLNAAGIGKGKTSLPETVNCKLSPFYGKEKLVSNFPECKHLSDPHRESWSRGTNEGRLSCLPIHATRPHRNFQDPNLIRLLRHSPRMRVPWLCWRSTRAVSIHRMAGSENPLPPQQKSGPICLRQPANRA